MKTLWDKWYYDHFMNVTLRLSEVKSFVQHHTVHKWSRQGPRWDSDSRARVLDQELLLPLAKPQPALRALDWSLPPRTGTSHVGRGWRRWV